MESNNQIKAFFENQQLSVSQEFIDQFIWSYENRQEWFDQEFLESYLGKIYRD